jgi:transglutaminase-like putative cysteine protease
MKTPPFLLFAALLFWSWQSDLLLVGATLGAVLESPRFMNWRWEWDDTDFHRITTFCLVLNVMLVGYVFTTNGEGGLSGMFHGHAAANVVNSGIVTSIRFLRWLPMTMFPFIAAQMFNVRPTVPLTAVSMVLRWRRRKGDPAFTGRYFSISFPYFIVCLFSAGIHANDGSQAYFWGQCALIAWALWSVRARRFGMNAWAMALAVVVGLGFLGQFGINEAQRVIQNFNAGWMARFFAHKTDVTQSMTSMGDIGELKLSAKIIIRLQPKIVGEVPAYLHEASYRTYTPRSRTWYAGGTLNDPFDIVQPETDNSSWILIPGKTNSASVNIACYLDGRSPDGDPEGVLPLPSGSSRLENLAEFVGVYALKKNKTGAVLATGPGLMIFDARYGVGAAADSPPDASTNNFDLTVPSEEMPALDAVISEMKISPKDDAQKKLLAVERFFAANFTYSTWRGEDKKAITNATPLTRFLLTSRSGHCEYFATATVLLLRELKIPARYAVGYAVHETSGSGYVVRERDAHAWCLAWNGKTWEDFDTTPASWVAVEAGRASFLEWLSDLKSWLGFQIEKFRYGQAHLQQYIFWSLFPVMVVLLYYIIFRRRGKLKAQKKNENAAPIIWPGLDSEFYQLENKLTARGLPRQPSEPLADWLERALAEPALADLRAPLRQLLRWHYRHRFDPQGLSAEERGKLKRTAKVCLDALLQAGKSAGSSS